MKREKRWLFVSDVDDTLVGDNLALVKLRNALETASNLITTTYNSSRPCASLRQTLNQLSELPIPDYLIGAMGTEIQEGPSEKLLSAYSQLLGQGWHRDQIITAIQNLNFTLHPSEYQTPFKISYDVPDANASTQVVQALQTAGLAAKVIYSGGKNLDIIPQAAGKKAGIEYLQQQLNIQAEYVVVAGDSGNDLEMFVAPYKGIVVANADLDLKKRRGEHIYHARLAYAQGVLEGLRFWQVL